LTPAAQRIAIVRQYNRGDIVSLACSASLRRSYPLFLQEEIA
jgi:hypothetical protein